MEMLLIDDIYVRCTPCGVTGERQSTQSVAVERQFTGNKIISARLSSFVEIL